ncbi:Kelch repeat type 1 [Corchorus olitorius]|uniref:Kelch repeat type 1 n=1 Tax=Corchorus olitorius TaxID=93759 RepID=A0A1R3H3V3_9ROSI|nr:Kelch repeat type 1 [Corchorus olitorius]
MSRMGLDSGAICFRLSNKKDGTLKIFSLKLDALDDSSTCPEFISELDTGIRTQTSWTIQGSVVYVLGCSLSANEVFSIDLNRPTQGWHRCPSMLVGRMGALTASCGGKIFMMGGNDVDDKSNPNPSWAEVFDPMSNTWEAHPVSQPLEINDGYPLTFRAVDPAGQLCIVGNHAKFAIFDDYAMRWQFFGYYESESPLAGSGLFIDNTIILVYKDVLQSYHIRRKEYSVGKIMGLQALGSSDSTKEPSIFHLQGSIYDSTAGARFSLVWSDLTSSNCLRVHYTTIWAVVRQHHDFLSLEAIVDSSKSFVIDNDPDNSKHCLFGGALVVGQSTNKRKRDGANMREIFKEKLKKQVSVLQTPPVSQKLCFRIYNEDDDMSRFYHVNLSKAGITERSTHGISPKWELKTGRESSWVMHESVLYVLGGYSSSCDPSEASEHNHVFCIDTSKEDAGAGGGWSECPSMIARRSGAMAAFLKGELYVMGGDFYIPRTTFGLPLEDIETSTGLPILGAHTKSWAECFNPDSKKWSLLPLPPPPFSPSFIACDSTKLLLGDFGVLQVIEGCNKLKQVEDIPSNFPFQSHGLFMDGKILFFHKDALYSYELSTGLYYTSRIVGLESILGYQCHNCEDQPSLIYLNGSIDEPAGARFCLVWSDRRPCDCHPSNDCLHVHCTTFHAVELWDHRKKISLEASVQASESFVIVCRQDSARSCHFEGALLL